MTVFHRNEEEVREVLSAYEKLRVRVDEIAKTIIGARAGPVSFFEPYMDQIRAWFDESYSIQFPIRYLWAADWKAEWKEDQRKAREEEKRARKEATRLALLQQMKRNDAEIEDLEGGAKKAVAAVKAQNRKLRAKLKKLEEEP